jgi:queuine tRNA-ribosyltransferase
MAEELLVYRLLSLHNLHFFLELMAGMRAAIAESAFGPFRTRFFDRYAVSSVVVPREETERPEADRS